VLRRPHDQRERLRARARRARKRPAAGRTLERDERVDRLADGVGVRDARERDEKDEATAAR
jgi:hypothetical protein